MATSPIFASTALRQAQARVAAANTARDGSGSIVDLITASATVGTRVDRVRVTAEVATTAGWFRLWLYNGSAYRLFHEEPVPAVTLTAGSTSVWEFERVFHGGLMLPPTWKLAITTHNAEAFNAFAEGGDFG
jgi:hypothetical protein